MLQASADQRLLQVFFQFLEVGAQYRSKKALRTKVLLVELPAQATAHLYKRLPNPIHLFRTFIMLKGRPIDEQSFKMYLISCLSKTLLKSIATRHYLFCRSSNLSRFKSIKL